MTFFFPLYSRKRDRIRSKEGSASSGIIPHRFPHDNSTIKSCNLIIGDIWSRPGRWCRSSLVFYVSSSFILVSSDPGSILDLPTGFYSIFPPPLESLYLPSKHIDICYEMRLTVMSSVHFFMCASLSKCLRSNSYKLLWCKKRLLIMETILALLSLLLLIVFEILHKLGSTQNPLGSKGCNIHIPPPSRTSNLLSFSDRILITR